MPLNGAAKKKTPGNAMILNNMFCKLIALSACGPGVDCI